MLRWRLLSAIPLIAILVGVMLIDVVYAEGMLFAAVLLGVAALASIELAELLRAGGLGLRRSTAVGGTLLVAGASCIPVVWDALGEYPPDCPLGRAGFPLAAAAVSVLLVFLGEMRHYEKPGGVIANVAGSVFVIGYIGIPLSFLALLRSFHGNRWGMAALISMIFVVKMSDIGAYFCGRFLGRRKMAPKLSPGKTIEGAIGGVAFSCIASWLFFEYFAEPLVGGKVPVQPLLNVAAYGIVVALLGMLGDLAESLIKRDMGSKDSGQVLPGLGGVLDVVDSVLLAAAPTFLCWAAGLIGP